MNILLGIHQIKLKKILHNIIGSADNFLVIQFKQFLNKQRARTHIIVQACQINYGSGRTVVDHFDNSLAYRAQAGYGIACQRIRS
ncbi:hypothetical protein D3C80_1546600 [compost metagenome]